MENVPLQQSCQERRERRASSSVKIEDIKPKLAKRQHSTGDSDILKVRKMPSEQAECSMASAVPCSNIPVKTERESACISNNVGIVSIVEPVETAYNCKQFWLSSHIKDVEVESMDWESSDDPVVEGFKCDDVLPSAWHIAVDTNVLLNNLEYIHTLRDTRYQSFGDIVITIPWVVLQELDHFKSGSNKNKHLQRPARNAISFIHKSLSMSHPKFTGQFSLDEEMKSIKIKNDDSIIKYCLSLRDEGKKVMLLTEDINLCNKAVIASIECHSVVSLKQWIDLSQKEADIEVKQEVKSTVVECTDAPLASIIKSAKRTMVDFLGKILESEMKAQFKETWLRIVLLRPPWSFEDILKCCEKHWMAVLSFVFDVSAQNLIKAASKLPAFRYSQTWEAIRKNEVKDALNLCFDLSKTVKSAEYKKFGNQAADEIKTLLEQLESGKLKKETVSDSQVAMQMESGLGDQLNKILYCYDALCSNVRAYCTEVESFRVNPKDPQLTHRVESKILTYYRLINCVIQTNDRLLKANGDFQTNDLKEMSSLLMHSLTLGDQDSNGIEPANPEVLGEFYVIRREDLLQAQVFLKDARASLSCAMGILKGRASLNLKN
ncbi:uncharacterized protein LOC132203894 isoform X2 [Neocloeon triangulifer]|uniref:uncharacterized protein LOC132203894 isoform X2 n=1 Tax=Neocloeon triangulifer TaxID=2078957 RepID=UPI00286EDD9E|nr:uncharacterized protein LOC132203894 isoform X2 [Neocloeon triangulifer]